MALDWQQAQERLEKLKTPDWLDRRLTALAGRKGPLRETGLLLLGRNEKGKPLRSMRGLTKRQERLVELFRSLPPGGLDELLDVLFPRMPQAVRSAMAIHSRLPDRGPYRMPFRRPSADPTSASLAWLATLVDTLEGYEADTTWVLENAPLFSWRGEVLGLLLAGAIEAGEAEILDRLLEAAHINASSDLFGQHVVTALLVAEEPRGWEAIENLLKAAQRQEGLRQAIVERVHAAHPSAFRRLLRVILEEGMARFASVARAVDVWFAVLWDSSAVKKLHETMELAARFLDDEAARAEALRGSEGEPAYLALWSIAYEDADAAVGPAAELLGRKEVDVRAAGAVMLAHLALPAARQALVRALDDKDPRIVALAAPHAMESPEVEYGPEGPIERPVEAPPGLFEKLEALLEIVPAKPKEPKPVLWPWLTPTLSKAEVAGLLLRARGDRSPRELIPFLPHLDANGRWWFVRQLAGLKPVKGDDRLRETLLDCVGDASANVREAAVQGLARHGIRPSDAARFEALLSRKSGDLRRAVLGLLLKMEDKQVLGSAERLLSDKAAGKRLAGLELLRELKKADRAGDRPRELGTRYHSEHPELNRDEQAHLDELLGGGETLRLDNALGLMNPTGRTPPAKPRRIDVSLHSEAAERLLKALDDLIHERRDEPIEVRQHNGELQTQPLGGIDWHFPKPWQEQKPADPESLPLREVWLPFWSDRPAAMRDTDGMELIRARAFFITTGYHYGGARDEQDKPRGTSPEWFKELTRYAEPTWRCKLRYGGLVKDLLEWLLWLDPPQGQAGFVLDALEEALARWRPDEMKDDKRLPNLAGCRARTEPVINLVKDTLNRLKLSGKPAADAEQVRLFQLLRFFDEPWAGARRDRVALEIVARAHDLGAASDDDIYDLLLGPRWQVTRYGSGFSELEHATGPYSRRHLTLSPAVQALVDRCRDRVVEVELQRGEKETVVSAAALSLGDSGGLRTFLGVLAALGRDKKLSRQRIYGWMGDNRGKASVLSHLLKVSSPAEGETPEVFAQEARAALAARDVTEDQLVAGAVLTPDWAEHVEAALAWNGFADAVWWVHAHTKGAVYGAVDETEQAQIRKRSPLTDAELRDGAVDVAWFRRAYEALGKKRWEVLYENAKYASESSGHARAKLFADAMLGQVPKTALVKDIKQKRKQDAVRAVGLLALAGGDRRKRDLLDRYKLIAEFRRTSKQFGSQRHASEKRAAEIGMDNLARTAGYSDPVRLQWAMETEAVADLAGGKTAEVVIKDKAGDLIVALSLDEEGAPQLQFRRGEKPLKSLPAAAKKDRRVKELMARRTDLRRSASRMRQSLELAMCRGDRFERDDLIDLFANPVLAPMLARLVFVTDGGKAGDAARVLGYPVDGGRGLRDAAGGVEPVKPDETLRLAHAHDLLSADWSAWQHEVFAAERVQPFKQVFRELYMPTGAEREGEVSETNRYAGQQVNPRQAMALLGGRGWVISPHEGVFRVDHDLGLVAWLSFEESFYTPAEVDGLTVSGVRFTKRGEWQPLPLAEVPPRLFSEALRDVDLVVSVAHRGGVDPEASSSTVGMRAALVRETAALLGLQNVRLRGAEGREPTQAVITGEIGEYSVHLGSGTCHKMPGGMLFLVPVHSQHRGRLFLPFADDDPKTAEILSKVLMLANDAQIKDPALLEQIRA